MKLRRCNGVSEEGIWLKESCVCHDTMSSRSNSAAGFAALTQLSGDGQQARVVFACCDQLHTSRWTAMVEEGNRDCRHAGQAYRRGVAQQARADLAVVGPRGQFSHW